MLENTSIITKLVRAYTILVGRIIKNPSGDSVFERPKDWQLLGFKVAPSRDFWNKFSERLNHDPNTALEWLGSGMKGVAYKLSNGKVAKITSDPKEAATALYIKEKQQTSEDMKFLFYNVEQVFPIKIGNLTRWVIVTELLSPFKGSDKESWIHFADQWGRFVLDQRKVFGKHPKLLPSALPAFFSWLKANKFKYTEDEKVWIERVAKTLAGNNEGERIQFSDLHGGNIMWRESTQSPVLIDFGGSQSPTSSHGMEPIISKLLLAASILES